LTFSSTKLVEEELPRFFVATKEEGAILMEWITASNAIEANNEEIDTK
jgi:hypothetical protein